ncbi:excinuclease ABC subunit UvrA [Membranicola marinus]|uniref:UvrABC system protein A n=1 Tax=Membranihabitans marinus TaxID=1227546 RepID=A0A953HUE0_9BACT|nr:excinuclease ABC subunit UvrA [Membranihabitans marinus]MBY5956641.1 excinuclease ABC subunit UvrA [Membranihabitans marinus]
MKNKEESNLEEQEYISISGARENNLQDIDVRIPRNKFVVITGISGSGKSSLAFDTLFAEGQRRYMETFGIYARQFIGKMERPDVDQITGLSPVISIEQKTSGWNPRSTVGTITELYDLFRLLYARIGEAYSWKSGKKMQQFTEEEIIERLFNEFHEQNITILAPLVRGRKGHYRELFEQIRKQGFSKVRIDGKLTELTKGLRVERYKVHDIEVVIDRIKVLEDRRQRMEKSIATAFEMGEGLIFIEEMKEKKISRFSRDLMDVDSGISYEDPSPNSFSFNSPYGACPKCNGLGYVNEVDMKKVLPDPALSINKGAIPPIGERRENRTFDQLKALAKHFGFTLGTPVSEIPKKALDIILHGGGEQVEITARNLDLSENSILSEGIIKMLDRWFNDSTSERIRKWAGEFMSLQDCSACHGYRLKKESLHFKINDRHIGEIAHLDLDELDHWLEQLPEHLNEKQKNIGKEVLKEIKTRLRFLLDVGLTYLTLNRPAKSLSGGESQRTRLANQIGSQLSGITYIMDEPSIGLHQRDNQRLITALHSLIEADNTVLVVEHDEDIMLASDYLIDIGPGAGKLGGRIVSVGHPEEVISDPQSITGQYLKGTMEIAVPGERRPGNGKTLTVTGARGHNLKNITVDIPLQTLTCITGVSGSGKSTLINETIYPALRKHFHNSLKDPLEHDAIHGIENLDKVIDIDQSPIGRTPRSNPATYTNVFTDIRKLYAEVPEAKIRGYKIGRFSFNVKGGRCEDCGGAGMKEIEMNFIPNVYIECPTCFGKRFNRETLEILYKGKNISDILKMTVDEAVEFFEPVPKIYRKLKTIQDVGLGYITLGQSATTLSGGEAQRVKLAEELAKRDTGNTLYILDEPTTGLHFQDIERLLQVVQKLIDKGNTFIIIEHNMDVIKTADHIIDIGPEGGKHGGQVIAQGTPEEVAQVKESFTAKFLRKYVSEDVLS